MSFHTQSDRIECDDDFASCGNQANRCSLPPSSPPPFGKGIDTLIGLLSFVGGSRLTIGPRPGISVALVVPVNNLRLMGWLCLWLETKQILTQIIVKPFFLYVNRKKHIKYFKSLSKNAQIPVVHFAVLFCFVFSTLLGITRSYIKKVGKLSFSTTCKEIQRRLCSLLEKFEFEYNEFHWSLQRVDEGIVIQFTMNRMSVRTPIRCFIYHL